MYNSHGDHIQFIPAQQYDWGQGLHDFLCLVMIVVILRALTC